MWALILLYGTGSIFAAIACCMWVGSAAEQRSYLNGGSRFWARQQLIRLALFAPITVAWPLALAWLTVRYLHALIREARRA